MTAPSPSNPAALSAWVLIACAAFRPALAAPAFPTDRVVLNRRQPSLASPPAGVGLTSNSPAWSTNASRPPLGLGGASFSSDQLGRSLRIHGGGSGGRIPGTSSPFFNIDNSAENDDNNSAATTDSLGLQLSDEISKCLGTSSSQHAHLSTRGGSTGMTSRPEEEQASSVIVDTAAKSTKDADDTNNAAQYAKKLKVCICSSIYLIVIVHFIFLVWLLHFGL